MKVLLVRAAKEQHGSDISFKLNGDVAFKVIPHFFMFAYLSHHRHTNISLCLLVVSSHLSVTPQWFKTRPKVHRKLSTDDEIKKSCSSNHRGDVRPDMNLVM